MSRHPGRGEAGEGRAQGEGGGRGGRGRLARETARQPGEARRGRLSCPPAPSTRVQAPAEASVFFFHPLSLPRPLPIDLLPTAEQQPRANRAFCSDRPTLSRRFLSLRVWPTPARHGASFFVSFPRSFRLAFSRRPLPFRFERTHLRLCNVARLRHVALVACRAGSIARACRGRLAVRSFRRSTRWSPTRAFVTSRADPSQSRLWPPCCLPTPLYILRIRGAAIVF